tara:strand:- start:1410 stop:1856 length:447 start_codon:yes stop_codon:yes gene_type:complete
MNIDSLKEVVSQEINQILLEQQYVDLLSEVEEINEGLLDFIKKFKKSRALAAEEEAALETLIALFSSQNLDVLFRQWEVTDDRERALIDKFVDDKLKKPTLSELLDGISEAYESYRQEKDDTKQFEKLQAVRSAYELAAFKVNQALKK